MFRTVPLSIIRSFSPYTQQWYMSYRFADSLRTGSCSTIAVCTVKNSWWWTEELSETCRFLFQNKFEWNSASSWFYYKNLLRCTVTWTSYFVSTLSRTYSTPCHMDNGGHFPKKVRHHSVALINLRTSSPTPPPTLHVLQAWYLTKSTKLFTTNFTVMPSVFVVRKVDGIPMECV